MTNENAQEPSMEDILSSIRRILAEDEDPAAGAPAETEEIDVSAMIPPEPASEPAPEMDEIDVSAMIPPEPAPEPVVEPAPAPMPEPAPAPAPAPVFAPTPTPAPAPMPALDPMELTDDMLMDEAFIQSSACSLASLAKMVAEDRNAGLGGVGITLEDIVRQVMRPFLKDWLDANLPYIVERIVKKEVERLVDRAKGM